MAAATITTVAQAVHDLATGVEHMAGTLDSVGARVVALEQANSHRAGLPADSAPGGFAPFDDAMPGAGSEYLPIQAALIESSGSGSYVVPEIYSSSVWDRLAPESAALASGIRLMPCSSDTLHIPRATADAAAAWVAEAATITATDPTLSEVIASPKKLAALVQLSNEVIADSNPAIVQYIQSNLDRALALKLDLGCFEGSGTAPEIRGLKNQSGIQTVSLGTNGATPTNLDPFADAIGLLAQANAEASAVVMHPRTWQTLIKLKEQTTGNNKPLLQESAGSGSAGVQRSVYGLPVFLTSQLSIAETQGTSIDCSSIYVYQANQIVGVQRSGTRIEFNTSRLFNSDQSEIRAIMRFDLVLPNPTAVCRVVGVRP